MRAITIPPAVLQLAARQGGLVSSHQCDRHGLTSHTRTRLVGRGAWTRITTGVFDTTPGAARQHDERRARSAWTGLLAYGPGSVATGQSALALHGVRGLPPVIRPEVATRDGGFRRPRAGIRVRQAEPTDPLRIGEHALVTLADALVHALPELPRRHGLAVVDDVLHRRLLSAGEVDRVGRRIQGRRGAVAVRTWWQHADARAASPFESFARLECIDAGIPPDELQLVLRPADGRGPVLGDLAWRLRRGRWLVVELDGAEFHDSPDAVLADRDRQNRIAMLGSVDLLRFAWPDLGTGRITDAVTRALALDRWTR